MSAKTKPSAKKPAKKRGRPSKFTPATAAAICERLSKGEPMAEICRSPRMPAVRTVTDWMGADETFSASIARARIEGYDAIAAECLRIADNPVLGMEEVEKEWGTEIKRGDMLGHRKLQIETRLKLLSKWDPKRYGDKLDVAHSGSVDIEVTIGGDDAE